MNKEGEIMSCKICGRSSCDETLHSIKEQEEFEKYENELDRYSRRDLIEVLKELDLLRGENEILGEVVSEYKYLVEDFKGQILNPSFNFEIEDYTSTLDNIKELEKKID
jgi:hypothetical protein